MLSAHNRRCLFNIGFTLLFEVILVCWCLWCFPSLACLMKALISRDYKRWASIVVMLFASATVMLVWRWPRWRCWLRFGCREYVPNFESYGVEVNLVTLVDRLMIETLNQLPHVTSGCKLISDGDFDTISDQFVLSFLQALNNQRFFFTWCLVITLQVLRPYPANSHGHIFPEPMQVRQRLLNRDKELLWLRVHLVETLI